MGDLAKWLSALVHLWDKRSGMSGQINMRAIWLFRHDNALGRAAPYSLFDRIKIGSKDPERARSWKDYSLEFDDTNMPSGVTTYRLETAVNGSDEILGILQGSSGV